MKNGDFVNIDYVGSVKSTGEIFDFTTKKVAKEMNREGDVGPITVVIGAGHVIPGLEDEILKHKEGDEFEVDIPAERAFGRRYPKLMQLIPLTKFRREKIDPIPGMRVTVNNMMGVVRSASGGRVIVDFNHPLAGKELHYWVRINKKINLKKDKVKALLDYHGLKDFKLTFTKDGVKIISPDIHEAKKAVLTREIQLHVKLKNIKFEAKKQTKSK